MEKLYGDELIEKANKIIPIQIEKGKKLIYPFRYEQWIEYVHDSAMSPNCGLITDRTLEILQAIEDKKPLEKIVDVFNKQDNNYNQQRMVGWRVMIFSKNGYPFYEAIHSGVWTLDECLEINDILLENEKYGELSDTMDTSKSKRKNSSRIKRLNKLEDKSIN